MDQKLRAYLELPVPRPGFDDPRHDDSRTKWLIALGAALTGGLIVGQYVFAHRERWLLGFVAWGLLLVLGWFAGHLVQRLTQSLYRNGLFSEAQVVATEVLNDGEDRTLSIQLVAEVPESAGAYRAAGTVKRCFRGLLTDRWIPGPFERGERFPILVRADGKVAVLFVRDETIEVAAESTG